MATSIQELFVSWPLTNICSEAASDLETKFNLGLNCKALASYCTFFTVKIILYFFEST